jgi:hypothetical protein
LSLVTTVVRCRVVEPPAPVGWVSALTRTAATVMVYAAEDLAGWQIAPR